MARKKLDPTRHDITTLAGVERLAKEIKADLEEIKERDRQLFKSQRYLNPEITQAKLATTAAVERLIAKKLNGHAPEPVAPRPKRETLQDLQDARSECVGALELLSVMHADLNRQETQQRINEHTPALDEIMRQRVLLAFADERAQQALDAELDVIRPIYPLEHEGFSPLGRLVHRFSAAHLLAERAVKRGWISQKEYEAEVKNCDTSHAQHEVRTRSVGSYNEMVATLNANSRPYDNPYAYTAKTRRKR
jgi:hypothetical protein